MLAFKLLQLMADHRDDIVARALRHLRQTDELWHIRRLPESRLRNWCLLIVTHLESRPGARELGRFETEARQWRKDAVPLHELVRGLHVLRRSLTEFVRDEGLAHTSVELYAEEGVLENIYLLFEQVVYHTVRGYEAERTLSRAAG